MGFSLWECVLFWYFFFGHVFSFLLYSIKIRKDVVASLNNNFLDTLGAAWSNHQSSMVEIRDMVMYMVCQCLKQNTACNAFVHSAVVYGNFIFGVGKTWIESRIGSSDGSSDRITDRIIGSNRGFGILAKKKVIIKNDNKIKWKKRDPSWHKIKMFWEHLKGLCHGSPVHFV